MCEILVSIGNWFTALDAQTQGTLITASVTILAAAAGIIAVYWQIGAQSRNGLKLDIYKQILLACRHAQSSEIAFSGAITKFQWDVEMSAHMRAGNFPWQPPTLTVEELLEKQNAIGEMGNALGALAEEWLIVDRRLILIQKASSCELQKIELAWRPYYQAVLPLISRQNLKWEPPNQAQLEKLKEVTANLTGVLIGYLGLIVDCRIESQRLLLGGLFRSRPSRRKPLDSSVVVLNLDHFEELDSYYGELLKKLHDKR